MDKSLWKLSPIKRWKIKNILTRIYTTYEKKNDIDVHHPDALVELSKHIHYSNGCDVEQEKSTKKGRFWFIPNDSFRIQRYINHAIRFLRVYPKRRYTIPKFLDCGSGLGFTLYLANKEISDVAKIAGIEINEKYAELSKAMFPKFDVFKEDILEFKNYKDYNIIYFYQPFEDCEFQKKFENKIIKDCKKGTVILGHFNGVKSQMKSSHKIYSYDSSFHYKF